MSMVCMWFVSERLTSRLFQFLMTNRISVFSVTKGEAFSKKKMLEETFKTNSNG